MLIGYNTNVSYNGREYHIQTEDTGLTNPNVVSLLYFEGAIIRSVKKSYAHLIGQPDIETQLRELMKKQHKAMVAALKAGRFESPSAAGEQETVQAPVTTATPDPPGPEPKKERPSKGLDEILLEHISRKVKQ